MIIQYSDFLQLKYTCTYIQSCFQVKYWNHNFDLAAPIQYICFIIEKDIQERSVEISYRNQRWEQIAKITVTDIKVPAKDSQKENYHLKNCHFKPAIRQHEPNNSDIQVTKKLQ
jgi:hypothetical protein